MSLGDAPNRPARMPEDLDPEELVSLVYAIQGYLYVELDARDKMRWNIDKEVNVADFVAWLSGRLNDLGLSPSDATEGARA